MPRKAKPRRYEVLSYDYERNRYTPATECGLPVHSITIHGVRRALKALRNIGYGADYRSHDSAGDPSLRVKRIDDGA